MFRFTPAHCEMRVCPDRTFLCRFPVDAADIWRTARRSDVALQAQGGCPCTETNAIACRLWLYTQCRVLGRVCCYISRYVFYLLSVDSGLWLICKLVTRSLLLDAERASCSGRAAAHPQLATRRACLQAVVLVRRPALGDVGAY